MKLMPVAFACDKPPEGACETHDEPSDVNTLPVVPGETESTGDVPLPIITALAVSVLAPRPPLETGRVPVTSEARLTLSVPPRVKEPVDVTVPVRVRPLTVPVPDTLVTVPPYWSADVMLKFG